MVWNEKFKRFFFSRSGPPGVGKTTTVQLVCEHLGYDTIEFNASDTRSKKLLQVEVAELLKNKTLHGYFNGRNTSLTEKQVLVMDEVDGMAGSVLFLGNVVLSTKTQIIFQAMRIVVECKN